MTNAGGIVLCGGKSSRMGTPKAWLPVRDAPRGLLAPRAGLDSAPDRSRSEQSTAELLLPRVVRIVSQVVRPVVVVAAAGQELPPLPDGVRVVCDAVADHGPLAGIVAGMQSLKGTCDSAFVSACDVPFLAAGFIEVVVQALQNDAAVVCAVPSHHGRWHPLSAAYRLELLPLLEERLTAKKLKLVELFDLVPTLPLPESVFSSIDPQLLSLANVNTPEEYAALRP